MARQRIVITGLGGVCALGNNVSEIWSAMREGRSAIGPLTHTHLDDLRVKIGAEIKDLPEHKLERRNLITMDWDEGRGDYQLTAT